ncbi:MAG: O-antigen ligase family protein [Oscillospiraceae bacterium]|nr:O-antigen ligase family protein [Oscillospiraceae bacterium]
MGNNRVLTTEYQNQYPVASIVVAVVLILLAPFLSELTSYVALAICLYRVFRYDAKVFATDYAILTPLVRIFKTSAGLTLLIILCLIAALVYLVREGARGDRTLVMILALLNYLMLRMQANFSAFLLCFGQIFLLWVLLPKQDSQSAVRTAKAFCISLLATSVYAFAVRNTWQLQELIGVESEAIWSTGIMRFHGLIGDPNYYMTMLIVGLALLTKLKEAGEINRVLFIAMGVAMTALGVLTYSKTFFLTFVLFGVVYIIWQFRNKNIFLGIFLVAAVMIAAEFLLFSEDSPFAVVLSRLRGSEDFNDLTTGRAGVYVACLKAICRDPLTFFFGYGFSVLNQDPHNIYLEITYYCGVVGFVLIVVFFASVISILRRQTQQVAEQGMIGKYVTLLMVLVLYFTLNGMFMVEVYPNFFLAFLAILIPSKQTQ